MKKFLLSIFTLTLFLSASAQQLENPGFENWIKNKYTFEEADDWEPAYTCVKTANGTSCEQFYLQVSKPHSGNFAIRMFAAGQQLGAPGKTLPLVQYLPNFTAKPSKITFWYKAKKGLTVTGRTYKYDEATNEQINIGTGSGVFGAQTEYTQAEISLTYEDNVEESDTLEVIFSLLNNPLVGDDFYLDDVELVYPTTGIYKDKVADVLGGNIITSDLVLDKSVEQIAVVNPTGVQVASVSNANTVNFKNLPEGLYFVTLKDGLAFQTIKVVKR